MSVEALWETAKAETTLGNARHAVKRRSDSRSQRENRRRRNNASEYRVCEIRMRIGVRRNYLRQRRHAPRREVHSRKIRLGDNFRTAGPMREPSALC